MSEREASQKGPRELPTIAEMQAFGKSAEGRKFARLRNKHPTLKAVSQTAALFRTIHHTERTINVINPIEIQI